LGNFYATLLMTVSEPPDQVALRSFAAALALRDAFVALTGLDAAFKLKWPNDVLLNGGKVAGILLESARHGAGMHLAVGVGVNLIAAPQLTMVEPGAVAPVSLLSETGIRVTPEAFLQALAVAFARWEATFVQQGFAPLREEWLCHAARLGEVIRARTGDQTREGVFATVDGAGNLMLRMSRETVAIPAAEVFF
jgi:BirA family transcriptional regulator, biotin operon repressor / biotin---[acetyl-CoA-carboxylase] ligase